MFGFVGVEERLRRHWSLVLVFGLGFLVFGLGFLVFSLWFLVFGLCFWF